MGLGGIQSGALFLGQVSFPQSQSSPQAKPLITLYNTQSLKLSLVHPEQVMTYCPVIGCGTLSVSIRALSRITSVNSLNMKGIDPLHHAPSGPSFPLGWR